MYTVCIRLYSIYTVYIRYNTVYGIVIYGSGQPYVCIIACDVVSAQNTSKEGNSFRSPLSFHADYLKVLSSLLKRILGIESTSGVLRECAQEPLQFY